MAEFSFTEKTEDEQGFTPVFHERVVPILEKHEAERLRLKGMANKVMGGAGAVGAGGAGAVLAFGGEVFYGIIPAVLGGMGVFGGRAMLQKMFQAGMSGELLPILCDFLGDMEYGPMKVDLSLAKRLGVVPNYESARTEDHVTGTHRGLEWSLTEARLTVTSTDSKGNRSTKTVFKGLIMQIPLPQPAPRIFFARDRGGVGNWFSETFSSSRRGMEKIEMGSEAFEKTYETYTDNPAAARDFLNDQLTDGLMMIAENEGGGAHVAAAMEGTSFLLAMPRSKDFLGVGSLWTPLTEIEEDLHEAFRDLTLPRRVIEALSGR